MDLHMRKKAISPSPPKKEGFSTILWEKVSRDKKNPGDHVVFGAMTEK